MSSSSAGASRLDVSQISVGDRVSHDSFGLGKVVGVEDKGTKSVVVVDFGSDGVKRLLLRMAPLEKL